MGSSYPSPDSPTRRLGRHLAGLGLWLVRQAAARAGVLLRAVATPAGGLRAWGWHRLLERVQAGIPRPGGTSHRPLPALYDLHPEARLAPIRELGLQTVPVELIKGTAVEGTAQRGIDFLPLPQVRTRDWQARWQRINSALSRLAILPPVDLVKFGDEYWVVDGHNRVAAALRNRQVAIDASVSERRLPGTRGGSHASPIASSLTGSLELRAAGQGRRPARTGQLTTPEISRALTDARERGSAADMAVAERAAQSAGDEGASDPPA